MQNAGRTRQWWRGLVCHGMLILLAASAAHAEAPALAGPALTGPALFRFQCRMMPATECVCAPGHGKPTVPYTHLMGALAAQPPRVVHRPETLERQILWRRQCGLLDGEDIAP